MFNRRVALGLLATLPLPLLGLEVEAIAAPETAPDPEPNVREHRCSHCQKLWVDGDCYASCGLLDEEPLSLCSACYDRKCKHDHENTFCARCGISAAAYSEKYPPNWNQDRDVADTFTTGEGWWTSGAKALCGPCERLETKEWWASLRCHICQTKDVKRFSMGKAECALHKRRIGQVADWSPDTTDTFDSQ